MKITMHYKNFAGIIDYDEQANLFHGKVKLEKDVITFQAKNFSDLYPAFKDSVDDYLDIIKDKS